MSGRCRLDVRLSAEAWRKLTHQEQRIVMALEDHLDGRFGIRDLDRRLEEIREMQRLNAEVARV